MEARRCAPWRNRLRRRMPSRPVRPPSRMIISPGIGGLTDDVLSGSRTHNRADLHTLRHIAGMIDLLYIAGGQTDLVAVGAVAVSRLASRSFSAEACLSESRYRDPWDLPHRSHAWPDIHKRVRTAGHGSHPPRQVAAPPKGSISVGWLWVSFLKLISHSSLFAVNLPPEPRCCRH